MIATRGDLPPPPEDQRPPSVTDAPRGPHSAKPAVFRQMIERAYPTAARVELFARGPAIAGWRRWGDEAEQAAEDAA